MTPHQYRPRQRRTRLPAVHSGPAAPVLVLVACLFALCACQAPQPQTRRQPTTPPSAASATASPSPGGGSARPSDSAGWTLTVYYTAVQSYHHGKLQQIRGCTQRDCQFGTDNLGAYPADFLDAVHEEGTGKITGAPYRGKYLSWSYDTGYWLDTMPVASSGGRLEPFHTAAADRSVLARGARFAVADCGRNEDGSPLDSQVCRRLRAATWTVDDEFTPGVGGSHHIDLYIGEENQDGFVDNSPLYVTATGARIAVGG